MRYKNPNPPFLSWRAFLDVSESETCTIIDGMAAIQSLANASGAKTFGEWCDKFSAYATSYFSEKCTRVDFVFDRYLPSSTKGG